MKNIIKISLYICLFSSIFCSCDEDSFSQVVTFDVPTVAPRLVVNCNYTIGEDSIVVIVGKSHNVGDSTFYSRREMKNAKVELFQNGVKLFDIPYYEKGTDFASGTIFQLDKVASKMTDGATYTLKVSSAGFENVESTQKVPTKPVISNPIFKKNDFIDNSIDGAGKKLDLVQFDLTDPSEENYYTIALDNIVQDTVTKKIFTLSESHSIDQQFTKSLFDDAYGSKHTINDAIFNGKKFSFRMGVGIGFGFWDPNTQTLIENIKLIAYRASIYSLTQEKYLYESSLIAKENELGSLFGEPVVINTNIKNGFGIFSIKNVSVIDIKIP